MSENLSNKYSTTQSLKEKEKKTMKERGVRMSKKKETTDNTYETRVQSRGKLQRL